MGPSSLRTPPGGKGEKKRRCPCLLVWPPRVKSRFPSSSITASSRFPSRQSSYQETRHGRFRASMRVRTPHTSNCSRRRRVFLRETGKCLACRSPVVLSLCPCIILYRFFLCLRLYLSISASLYLCLNRICKSLSGPASLSAPLYLYLGIHLCISISLHQLYFCISSLFYISRLLTLSVSCCNLMFLMI